MCDIAPKEDEAVLLGMGQSADVVLRYARNLLAIYHLGMDYQILSARNVDTHS